MEKEIKNEEIKQAGEQSKQKKRQIIITIDGNNVNLEKCETASVFELQGILENILRKVTTQQ